MVNYLREMVMVREQGASSGVNHKSANEVMYLLRREHLHYGAQSERPSERPSGRPAEVISA